MVGPSWVIFTVMGAGEFAVHGHGISATGGSMLGMSILLGGRGLGALVGPLVAARWAGQNDRRLRLGILYGYLTVAFGYGMLGASRNVWMAASCAMLAHMGGSTVWVFSTTLLQLHTEDRFRGRVFAANLGLGSLTFAVTAYLAGRFLDAGISARVVAIATGILMLIPSAILAWASGLFECVPFPYCSRISTSRLLIVYLPRTLTPAGWKFFSKAHSILGPGYGTVCFASYQLSFLQY